MFVFSVLVVGALTTACGDSHSPATTGQTGVPAPVEIVVSAASDLSPVLDELAPLFEEATGVAIKTNLGSTGQLMEQIAAGARVDVFLAASASAIEQLDEKGLVVAGSARLYARGVLVMWTPEGSETTADALEDLAGPDIARLAIANPDHAPYGKAAREALQSAGLWEELQPKLVPAENVRQAFQFAESGNVDVGLVSLSLVVGKGGHYAVIPESLHNPIEQTLALIAGTTHESEARSFVDFLTGPEGRELLLKYGFVLPEE